MYLVTRADLTPAQQAVQAAHAAVELVQWRPLRTLRDHSIVLLAAPDIAALQALTQTLGEAGIPLTMYFEPDLDHQLTAIAFTEKPPAAVRRLPLALQEESHARAQKP